MPSLYILLPQRCTFHCRNPVHFTAVLVHFTAACTHCTFHCCMDNVHSVHFNCCMPCTFHCCNTVHFIAARRVLQTVLTRCACSRTSRSCTRCRTAPCPSSAGLSATPTAHTPGSAAPLLCPLSTASSTSATSPPATPATTCVRPPTTSATPPHAPSTSTSEVSMTVFIVGGRGRGGS